MQLYNIDLPRPGFLDYFKMYILFYIVHNLDGKIVLLTLEKYYVAYKVLLRDSCVTVRHNK